MKDKYSVFIRRHTELLLLASAALLFALSFISRDYQSQIQSQVRRAERSVQKRQRLMEHYVIEALKYDAYLPDDLFDEIPEDMVIYKYRNDTLQFWVNEFPISNDEVDVYPFSYRLQYMSNSNLFSAPLAYVGVRESYVNLGSAWYVINTQFSPDMRSKVVTGIRIKTEYTSDNISGKVNPRLHLGKHFTTETIMADVSAVVYGREGGALFSIVPENANAIRNGSVELKWVSLLLVVAAIFSYHTNRRSGKSFLVSIAALVAVRVASVFLAAGPSSNSSIFSPMVYAGNLVIDSLGTLLIYTAIFSMAIYLLFITRFSLYRRYRSLSIGRRRAFICLLAVLSVLTLCYVHLMMRSLIINSNIVLEPFRLQDFTFYSILCYCVLAMLSLALLLLLQIIVAFTRNGRRITMFAWKNIIAFSIAMALYCVVLETSYGLKKEYEINRTSTAKLAVERDLTLELYLRSAEQGIMRDPFIGVLTHVHGLDLIQKRLMDRYLYKDIVRKYNIKITACSPDDLLDLGGGDLPVGCYSFYEDQLNDYGVPLDPNSNFFYINNFNGRTSYVGVFTFVSPETFDVSRLFIEFEAKYAKDPFDLWNLNNRSNLLPSRYSFARYFEGRLVRNSGSCPYASVAPSTYPTGYSKSYSDGYIHFVNNLSANVLTIVSRPRHPFFPYIISLSYITIFLGLFLSLATRRSRKQKMFTLPKYSLRRKISYITTGVVCVTLVSLGITMVSYTVRLQSESERSQMERTLALAQDALSNHCRYAMRYNELNTPDFYNAMDGISETTGSDINVFDTHGSLIRSTNPDIYDQFIVGKRMDNKAYHEIVHLSSLRYIGLETAANLTFYSLYAPLFNADGNLVAIINIPYMSERADMSESMAGSLSMIINICLVLLLVSVLVGRGISNWMLKPLEEVKIRLDSLALSQNRNRHIIYRNQKDEIGVLVSSYNRMVDALDESTRRLARNERRQAWMDMASKIAHDIKNPLTPMRLSIQYLMKLKEEGVPGWEDKLDRIGRSILEQIDILSDAASQFSTMASSETPTQVDMNELIREVLLIFSSNENVSFDFQPAAGEVTLITCRKKINRAFVNLVTNSVQAIENGAGRGRVRISTSLCDGNFCRFDIEDDGPGVKEDDVEKLFTSSFTTKSSGSGLGLTNCKIVVEQSRGTISYRRSEDLGGACFSITLPM